jgi:hypothetical protein
LLSRLQAFRKVIQTTLDRALFTAAATAALLVLLSLLSLLSLLTVVQRLLTFANAIRNTIARERVCRFLQLPRRALLALTSSSHRTRRLLEILLQTVDAIGKRIFALAQLFARSFRVFILRALATATREVIHVFRNLALSRRRLRSTLSQIADLLLTA